MENKVLYKAKAADKINVIIWAVISLIIAILDVLVLIPVKTVKVNYWSLGYYYHDYNVYGQLVREYDLHDEKGVFPFLSDFFLRIDGPTIILLIVFTVLFILSLSLTIYAFKSRKCILELNPDGIQGKVKKLFSSKSINQPFEQIDNLYIRKNIIDIITGGKTIAISSGGSKIKFSCVANAQEFVDKTLEELKKYKESVNYKAEKAVPASSGNAMDDLLKLKTLLDQGLITQEEFEKKKNGIIEKI